MELCLWANTKFEISFPATVFFSYIFELPLASLTVLVNVFEAVNNLPVTLMEVALLSIII